MEKEDYETVRTALVPLFAHKVPTASFVYTAASNKQRYKTTWKFLRSESMAIGAETANLDVYELHEEGQLGNYHHSIWTLWLDPGRGLWTQSSFIIVSGQAVGVTTNGSLRSVSWAEEAR